MSRKCDHVLDIEHLFVYNVSDETLGVVRVVFVGRILCVGFDWIEEVGDA
jgi:hypothetical protein